MPAERRVVLAVACEDSGHYEAVTRLTDRRIQEEKPCTREALDGFRAWLDDGGRPWALITAAKSEARELGRKTHGHFGGTAGGPEAKRCRAQLLLWMERRRRGVAIDVAMLVRDLDHRDDRREQMMLAVSSGSWPFAVLAVWCQPEVEAWSIACFVPEGEEERRRLSELRKRLSFCPVAEPERMTSATRDPQRDAKKIAVELFASDEERRQRWFDLPLDTLRARGETIGLADFLRQIDAQIVPLFRQSPPET